MEWSGVEWSEYLANSSKKQQQQTFHWYTSVESTITSMSWLPTPHVDCWLELKGLPRRELRVVVFPALPSPTSMSFARANMLDPLEEATFFIASRSLCTISECMRVCVCACVCVCVCVQNKHAWCSPAPLPFRYTQRENAPVGAARPGHHLAWQSLSWLAWVHAALAACRDTVVGAVDRGIKGNEEH